MPRVAANGHGARVPQIIKNYREKSCEGSCVSSRLGPVTNLTRTKGLALLFFLLSLTGNMTYGLSLVAYCQDKKYLLRALPWLLGSLGTMVEDCIIFIQFRLYANQQRK